MPLLRLHGPPSITLDDAQCLALSAREAALLAWLQAEGPTPRARIAGLLWPAGTEAQARANLRQTLARLRRAAGTLVHDTDGHLHLADTVAVAEAEAAAQPLLGGLVFDDAPEFAQWLALRREDALRRQLREGLARAQAAQAVGDVDTALATADALLATQPENEEAWRLRMTLLYQRGDRAAAVAAWDACRHTLRTSFGITPSAATNELGRLILADDTGPGPATGASGGASAGASGGASAARQLPLALRRPPQLVARRALLDTVAQALALGHSVVLTGPGGIGKSRVLQAAATACEPALRIAARPGDAVVPGLLLDRVLAGAIDRFAPPLDEATRRALALLAPEVPAGAAAGPGEVRSALEHRSVLAAVMRTLHACRAAGLRLLVVDDLQFADDASLAVLGHVAGEWLSAPAEGLNDAAGEPQLLLSARADELSAAGAALVDFIAHHGRGGRLALAPLGPDALRALLAALPLQDCGPSPWTEARLDALAQALHAAIGGNPAFVLEALRSLWPDGLGPWQPGAPLPVPPTLLASVRARLQRLPDEALQLAQLAAVAQADFGPELAAAAFGRSTLAMAPLFAALETAQVFEGAAFSHDLVAEATRSSLPSALRPPLHRLVAAHLARHGGAPSRVAHHLLSAGDAAAAAPWQLSAARAARARWQLAEAAAGYEAAARSHASAQDDAAAFDAWCEALRCWITLGRTEHTRRGLEAAAALPRQVHQRARLRARALHHHLQLRQLGEAAAAAQQLVDELHASLDALDADELVFALRGVCTAVQNGMPAEHVLALCQAMRPRIERAGGPALAGFALAQAGPLLWDARPQEAAAALEAVWPGLDEQADPELRRSVANQLMRVRQALGDLPGAAALGEQLLARPGRTSEDAAFDAEVLHILAMVQVAMGRAAAGFASMAAAEACLRAAGEPAHEMHALTAALSCLACGRLAQAQALLDHHAGPPGREGFAMHDHVQFLVRARLAHGRGDDAGPWIARYAQVQTRLAGALLHRRVVIARLRPGTLAEMRALLAEVQSRGQRGLQRTAALAAARAALNEGAGAEAMQHARMALSLAACVDGWSDEPARVWLEAAEVLAACGDTAQADAAWREGRRWVQEGAAQWQDPADRQAWCEGNPVHRRLLASGGPGGAAGC